MSVAHTLFWRWWRPAVPQCAPARAGSSLPRSPPQPRRARHLPSSPRSSSAQPFTTRLEMSEKRQSPMDVKRRTLAHRACEAVVLAHVGTKAMHVAHAAFDAVAMAHMGTLMQQNVAKRRTMASMREAVRFLSHAPGVGRSLHGLNRIKWVSTKCGGSNSPQVLRGHQGELWQSVCPIAKTTFLTNYMQMLSGLKFG